MEANPPPLCPAPTGDTTGFNRMCLFSWRQSRILHSWGSCPGQRSTLLAFNERSNGCLGGGLTYSYITTAVHWLQSGTPPGQTSSWTDVEEMLAAGIIKPSHSEWCIPVVLVSKKDDPKLRLSVNFVKLNPMPRLKKSQFLLPADIFIHYLVFYECIYRLQDVLYWLY